MERHAIERKSLSSLQKSLNPIADDAAGCLIIAEAGVNHDGSMQKALDLIRVAADAGADVVKFQTFSADRLSSRSARKATYQIETTGGHETQWAMLKRLEISRSDHRVLFNACLDLHIEFMSTPFDEISADELLELGVKRFKIPSGEVTNLPLLRHLARLGKPLILSTGMSDLDDVSIAVQTIRSNGNVPLTILHCVSAYPASPSDCNLRAMRTMASAFDVPVGFSDHTIGNEVSFAAVALGATVIEKHFTLDTNDVGPDHRASASPAELRQLITGIRRIESALGDGVKQAVSSEHDNRNVVRKSIVAQRAIVAGEIFTRDSLAIRRPGTGLPPSKFESVLGCRAVHDLEPGEPIMAQTIDRDL